MGRDNCTSLSEIPTFPSPYWGTSTEANGLGALLSASRHRSSSRELKMWANCRYRRSAAGQGRECGLRGSGESEAYLTPTLRGSIGMLRLVALVPS